MQIDEAVAQAVLTALAPLGIETALAAAERIEADRDGALAQWRLAVERASYEAQRGERRASGDFALVNSGSGGKCGVAMRYVLSAISIPTPAAAKP
jgi:hypothetical protein